MKLSKQKLKQLIKEEMQKVFKEDTATKMAPPAGVPSPEMVQKIFCAHSKLIVDSVMRAASVKELTKLLLSGFAAMGPQGKALQAMVGPIIAQVETMVPGNLEAVLNNSFLKLAAMALFNTATQALCKRKEG